MNDDLGPARGIVIGTMLGFAAWAVILGTVLAVIRWAGWW